MKLVHLTQGEFAMVDDEDYDLVSPYKWQCHIDPRGGRKYAVRHDNSVAGRPTVWMHRFILAHHLEHTDHADHNGLNNQKANLRPATRVQNGQNRKIQKHSSRFKGVHRRKDSGRFQAYIRINKKLRNLGFFSTQEEAARAYDVAALENFGAFAATNSSMGLL